MYDSRIFSQQRVGGVSRYFAELHRGFSSIDEIEAIVAAGAHANSYLDRAAGGLLGARLNRFPGPAHRGLGRVNDALLSKTIRFLTPDIVHYTTYVQPPVAGSLTVTTVHDFIHDLFPQYFDTAEYAERQAAAVAASDGIICISESTRKDMERIYGESSAPVLVSHHGVSGVPIAAASAPKLVARRQSNQFILFVGSRFGYKGFDVLLDALREVGQKLHLVCVGPPITDEERAQARRAGVDPSQLSAFAASDRELIELYRTATALVYPSRYEGFGLPIAEAMAQGCPVVCGRTSSLPEVGGTAAHYFDAHNGAAIARALRLVLDLDADDYEATSVACVEQAQMFTWASAVERHRDFYRRLAS